MALPSPPRGRITTARRSDRARGRGRGDALTQCAVPAASWKRVHLCTGILRRNGALLLVASRYPNHPEPLWNLPGGRQEAHELLTEALRREFLEETQLSATVVRVAYVSESYDRATSTHFLNTTFEVHAEGKPAVPAGDAHAVSCAWVPLDEVESRLHVDVVREPLVSYLRGRPSNYFGYVDAGITIEFNDTI